MPFTSVHIGYDGVRMLEHILLTAVVPCSQDEKFSYTPHKFRKLASHLGIGLDIKFIFKEQCSDLIPLFNLLEASGWKYTTTIISKSESVKPQTLYFNKSL